MSPILLAIAQAAPALAMLAVFALVAGGFWQLFKGRDRNKGILMLVLALVILANVMIWTI